MFILGLFLAIVIGVILGLVGGGGAILTIPLVVYCFGETMDHATVYSLVVVTLASVFGVIQRIGKNLFAYKEALIFVFPSMFLAFIVSAYRKQILPEHFELFGTRFSRDLEISLLLVVVMSFVALRMLKPFKGNKHHGEKISWVRIVLLGILTGCLSGFLGAGGGFVIVPILMSLGLEIKKAVATSMLIIAIQSAIALLGNFLAFSTEEILSIDWKLVFLLALLSIVGVFIGTHLQRRITGKILRRMFAIILLVVAIGIFIDRILLIR